MNTPAEQASMGEFHTQASFYEGFFHIRASNVLLRNFQAAQLVNKMIESYRKMILSKLPADEWIDLASWSFLFEYDLLLLSI